MIYFNGKEHPAGTVIYTSNKNKESQIAGIYHIKGIALRKFLYEEDRIKIESGLFNLIFSYYYIILHHFNEYFNYTSSIIYLPPVPGSLYKGSVITEIALVKAVDIFIDVHEISDFTIIMGIDEKKIKEIKSNPLFNSGKYDYSELLYNAINIFYKNPDPESESFNAEKLSTRESAAEESRFTVFQQAAEAPRQDLVSCPLINDKRNVCYMNSVLQLYFQLVKYKNISVMDQQHPGEKVFLELNMRNLIIYYHL